MKPVFALGRRRWSTVLLGAALFNTPWLLGTPAEEASSVNAWIVGVSLIIVAWRLPVVAGHVAASLTGILLTEWLLISPFALGFAGSAAAWCAWTAGVLALTLCVSPEAVFDVAAWLQAWRLRHGLRQISPQQIARYEEPVQTLSPQMLSRSIVERGPPDPAHPALTPSDTRKRDVRRRLPLLRDRHGHAGPYSRQDTPRGEPASASAPEGCAEHGSPLARACTVCHTCRCPVYHSCLKPSGMAAGLLRRW